MKPNAYLIFHLNLAFSSIDKHHWNTVVERCYWPLLDIISDLDIPLGIELSAWTLNGILETSPEWVSRFRELLHEGKCELIGSGYCQIISPIVPYGVNVKNQEIGLQLYEDVLGVRPAIALVNEMAFSDSFVDVLSEVGYSGFVMDRDNIRLAIGAEQKSMREMPGLAKGTGSAELPVIWGDSILFQKLQQVSHGDISTNDYVKFIEKKISMGECLFPLYCNDAETFDFRPGRFKEERRQNADGEWNIIRNVLAKLKVDLQFQYISPSSALAISNSIALKTSTSLTSANYPIPVKKQAKYNIARWAVTGRDDTWLNSMCYRIYKKLVSTDNTKLKSWENLCELWASDFRTHLTDERWSSTREDIKHTLKKLELSDHYGIIHVDSGQFRPVHNNEFLGSFKCRIFGDGIYLEIESKNIKLILNLRRGLVIDSLTFASHGDEACIGTLKHGHLDSILQGADYYSGGIIIEIPESKVKVTDLSPVEPSFVIEDNGDLILRVFFETHIGRITKYIKVSNANEQIKLSYKLSEIKRYISSARVGNLTLSPEFSRSFDSYSCQTGGSNKSEFQVNGSINQSQAATSFVSSSRGFSGTAGDLLLDCSGRGVLISWDPSECSPLCFIDHKDDYTRVSFSICEIDETSRESDQYGDLEILLSSAK
jgi:hypothetical protein